MEPFFWSPKQKRVRDAILGVNEYRTIVIPGPVQCGKTFSATFSFMQWAMTQHSERDFILGGRTAPQVEGTLLKYAAQFSHMANGNWKRRGHAYEMRSNLGGVNRFYVRLGGTKGTGEKVQGLTVQGALLDEVTTLDPEFVNRVADRCSLPGAKLVMMCNPTGPLDPIKTEFVDRADDDPELCHIPFELADNPNMTQAYVNDLNKRLTGFQFRRLVLGEWVASEGLVYPHIGESISEPPRDAVPVGWSVGIDYAHSSSTHAVAVARLSNGQIWVMDEWEWDGRDRGILSDPEQADRLVRWFGDRNIGRVSVDPSALPLIAELNRRVSFPVYPADNDVEEGIGYVRRQTETGKLWVSKRCPKLISQLHNYRWDERLGLLGIDKPIKENDHGCDALRYDRWTGAAPRKQIRVTRRRGRRYAV